jgi:hypothetical protein
MKNQLNLQAIKMPPIYLLSPFENLSTTIKQGL